MRREKNGEALELFYLLGFLPGGISESDLQLLWPNDDWPILAELLRKASLLVEKVSGGFSGETRGQTKY